MFEDRTYDKILEEALATAPAGVDTRPGSIFYDAVAGVCFQVARYYADLATAFELVFLTTGVDVYLDMKGSEYDVYRRSPTPAKYRYEYEGSQPALGARFFTDGKYYKLVRENNKLLLEAEDTGAATNDVPQGSPAVPVITVGGLTASTFGELIEPGTDTEDDEDFRQRIREKIAGPAENGNRQHYKTWCEEVPGVGRARIIPLWNGDNTVKGILVGTDGAPAAASVVERVQEYIDPDGTGLGIGRANIGAYFTAAAAEPLAVTVSFSAVLASSATIETATEEATEAIREHLKTLALDTPEDEKMVIRISTIGALLYALPSLVDYGALKFNGSGANIEVEKTQVAVLEEVSVYAPV